jgi:secreted PhoX family phosphatase
MQLSRRALLQASLAALAPKIARATTPLLGLPPGKPDQVQVLTGWSWKPLVAMGEPISAQGDIFGCDADFTAVFPLSDTHILLWVNHEFPPSPILEASHKDGRLARFLKRTPTPDDMKSLMGASVIELVKEAGGWRLVEDSKRGWRLSGLKPGCKVTGAASEILGTVPGSLSNCGGGKTPWNTVLSCEENQRYHVKEGLGTVDGRIGEGGGSPGYELPGIRGEWYGWVVEADPYDSSWQPRRHTALGRLRHESAVVVAAHKNPLKIYMTDDRASGGIWRFTSQKLWKKGLTRDAASQLLEEGTLEIARLEANGSGRWQPVTLSSRLEERGKDAVLRFGKDWKIEESFIERLAGAESLQDLYQTPGALLVDAWLAGVLAGGSLLGRPEGAVWIEDALFVALTSTTGLKEDDPIKPPIDSQWGAILKIQDQGEQLKWSVFDEAGGAFARPDNVGVDSNGLLLVATDADEVEPWGHNGLYRWNDGWERMLLAPPEAEVCGPSVAPDGVIFCSIQHPVESVGESFVGVLQPDKF